LGRDPREWVFTKSYSHLVIFGVVGPICATKAESPTDDADRDEIDAL